MSVAQLISVGNKVTPLDIWNPVYINPISGTLTFAVIGTGTGTWSATVTIIAVHAQMHDTSIPNVADSAPITLTISNTAPGNSTTVLTAHRYYSAYISALSGTVAVSASVEG